MDIPHEFIKQVDTDIKCIENANKLDYSEKMKLHRRLDARYQACIANWYSGLWGSTPDGKTLYYASLEDSQYASTYLIENLQMMQGKLETFRYGMNATKAPDAPTTNVNVTTNLNLDITFDQAKEKIQDMTSLTEEQTKEILKRINQLESAINKTASKKSKWEAIKPTLTWLAKESFDVAKVILPLLLKV